MSKVIRFNHTNYWFFVSYDHPYMFAFRDYKIDSNGFVWFKRRKGQRGYLNISFPWGRVPMEIRIVAHGSSAERAGVKVGDIITHINGKDVRKIGFAAAVNEAVGPIGTTVDLTIYRPSERRSYTFTVERTGELVEKTDEYVKLNMYGIDITYWMDEVESITTKEDNPSDVKDMSPASVISPAEVYKAYLSALEVGDWQEIKKYVVRENIEGMESSGDVERIVKMLKAFRPRNVEILKEDINGDKAILKAKGEVFGGMSEGTIKFIYEDNTWKIINANWKPKGKPLNLSSPNNAKPKQGTGVISGMIILPDVDKTGKLYIHFSPAGQIISTSDSPRYYTIVDADKITSNIVPYRIENVPAGNYWGGCCLGYS